ncbi:Lrp/AsnC family transcriptional regulator [Candidatus Bathyarchaeota archaeon]|nr:Lrp/AsnC family transcriptional regulator [Candidatus Bathyarchaeota archaeon]MBS7612840.1 Lrp/AsnC family transcriptional regulator [Candidatus Bathyarchaeota archaeon]MBS7617700.1 Lrp/AsnC family transcriptional regulator [Candidatus Bathyarchaeota archaeon]
MVRLDDIDRQILEALKRNSRVKYTELARTVGVTEGAIRRRVNRLVKSGVIKKFTVEIGATKPLLKALVLISARTSHPLSIVSEKVKKLRDVEAVYEVSGLYDIVAIIKGSDVSDLNNCIDEIRKIDGVESTNTLVVLRESS